MINEPIRNNLFGDIAVFRNMMRLKRIERWKPGHADFRYSVADHSFGVACLAMMVARQLHLTRVVGGTFCSDVLSYALMHDVHESVIGDIPHHVKYHSEQTVQAIHTIENSVMPYVLNSAHAQTYRVISEDSDVVDVVKFADYAELFITYAEEYSCGNCSEEILNTMSKCIDLLLCNRIVQFDIRLDTDIESNRYREYDYPLWPTTFMGSQAPIVLVSELFKRMVAFRITCTDKKRYSFWDMPYDGLAGINSNGILIRFDKNIRFDSIR